MLSRAFWCEKTRVWRSASWHFAGRLCQHRKWCCDWNKELFYFSPRGLGCLLTLLFHFWRLWQELFSRVLAHITVGEHQRSERGIIKRPGAELKRVGTKREVTGEALTSPPWEVWTPGRCPHPSWSRWSHQTHPFIVRGGKIKLLRSLLLYQ